MDEKRNKPESGKNQESRDKTSEADWLIQSLVFDHGKSMTGLPPLIEWPNDRPEEQKKEDEK